MDALICPAGPSAGIPHDFRIWWGYFSIFNLLDYPSIILPIKDLKIDAEKDPKDPSYQPRDNAFDRDNWEICTCSGMPLNWMREMLTLLL